MGTTVGDVASLDDKAGDADWHASKPAGMLGNIGGAMVMAAKAISHQHSIDSLVGMIRHEPKLAHETF